MPVQAIDAAAAIGITSIAAIAASVVYVSWRSWEFVKPYVFIWGGLFVGIGAFYVVAMRVGMENGLYVFPTMVVFCAGGMFLGAEILWRLEWGHSVLDEFR